MTLWAVMASIVHITKQDEHHVTTEMAGTDISIQMTSQVLTSRRHIHFTFHCLIIPIELITYKCKNINFILLCYILCNQSGLNG